MNSSPNLTHKVLRLSSEAREVPEESQGGCLPDTGSYPLASAQSMTFSLPPASASLHPAWKSSRSKRREGVGLVDSSRGPAVTLINPSVPAL